jgi:GNAT superfamily N-acetyltransferase
VIRDVTIDDLKDFEETAREFYATSQFLGKFSLERFVEMWTYLLTGGDGVIFAEDCDGEIVGAIGGIVHRDIYSEGLIAEEFFWFVKEAHRGRGLRLYRRFEEWARGRGAGQIQMVHLLDVMPERVSRFYTRSGFHPVETRYAKELRA